MNIQKCKRAHQGFPLEISPNPRKVISKEELARQSRVTRVDAIGVSPSVLPSLNFEKCRIYERMLGQILKIAEFMKPQPAMADKTKLWRVKLGLPVCHRRVGGVSIYEYSRVTNLG